VRPRFRQGEVVRLPASRHAPLHDEAVVEDLVGPDEDGAGWLVLVWVGETGGTRSLWTFPEDELEATGLAETDRGDRIAAEHLPPAAQRFDTLQLRLVTDIADGITAARAAEQAEAELRKLVGASIVSVEAERHWHEPFHYELDVTVRPLGDAVAALQAVAEAGGDGWLSVSDDGWRCDLWWNGDDCDATFFVPEVRGAEVAFLPWGTPRRRPEEERPLVAVLDA
jgi:hypothetical protein